MNDDVFDELSRYDADVRPAERYGTMPSTKDIPPGIYACTITTADVGRTRNNHTPILRLTLQARGALFDLLVEHAYVIGDQNAADHLVADLVALGLDADKWIVPHRPFSSELPKALPKLVGIRFQARKRTYAKAGETKENETGYAFDISGLLKGEAPASPRPAPPPPAPAPARPAAPLRQPVAAATSEPLPF